MDEDTLNFFQYNLNIFPKEAVTYAITYIMKLLGVLLNVKKSQKGGNYDLYYKDILKGIKKQLDKFQIKSSTLKPKQNKEKEGLCESIIADFNNDCLERTEMEMEQSQLAKREE